MVLFAERPERLDRFLAQALPQHSRTKLARLAAEGLVLVDGKPQRSSFALMPGMRVELEDPQEASPHDLQPAEIPLDVLYEDDDLLIVNKPRGLATHPAASLHAPSLVNALLARSHPLSQAAGAFRPGIVHRLDKETTGLIVVAKNDFSHVRLAKQIERKEAERRYVAVAAGDTERERFIVDAPIARDRRNRLRMAVDPDGKPAVTHVKRLGRVERGVVLAIRLETGRTHQIRVHLRAVGLPVLGDSLYAPKGVAEGPLQLHACYLALRHPRTEEPIAVFSPPPDDFLGRDLATRTAVAEF
ncbi:MAG TPA: RluA family pseudouridine synthase [Fimbriimonadaceae bacterium]|nr:RluA family pseudouridine synthase [Fimbriimonadaceae bacterium]